MKRLIYIGVSVFIMSCSQEHTHEEHSEAMQMDHEMSPDELHLSDQQLQLGNITTDSVTEHTLGEEFLITGTANVNQNQSVAIASRAMGRIDKLYFKNVGDVISTGDLLYEIYSEDLNMAVKELLLTNEKLKTLKNEQVDMQKILESARTKLKLYGLTDKQITELEARNVPSNTIPIYSPAAGVITSVDLKQGDYVMEGANVYHLADLSTLWIEGQVYSDYLNFVKNGMEASVTFPGYPDKQYKAKISFINPELNTSSKINTIRIEIPNTDGRLKPGIQAYINVITNQIKVPAVPTDAILMDGQGATVWVKTGENMFRSKMVTTGLESNGYTEIKSGLERGEEIVITGAYLLNSEYVFKKGVNPMEGHDMSKM